jgi:hypothetical protein
MLLAQYPALREDHKCQLYENMAPGKYLCLEGLGGAAKEITLREATGFIGLQPMDM